MGYLPYDITLKAILWIVTVCFLAVNGTLLLNKMLKTPKEKKFKRDFYLAFSLFCFLCIGLGIFFILSDFERDVFGESELYFRFLSIAYTFGYISLISIIFVGEREIVNTKYIFSYATALTIVINVIFLIFFPNLVLVIRYVNYVLFSIETGVAILVYSYLSRKTTGELRKMAIITLLAFIIVVIAFVLQTDFLLSRGLVSPYISQFLLIIGLTLFTYEIIRKEGLDVLEMISNHKLTTLQKDFIEIIEKFEWKGNDQEEFIHDLLGLTPSEREKILYDMRHKFLLHE
ncbi:MAG: hypothetical protein ACXADW_21115 [Candidatus Hodarchaeales archaeon]|jgi:hypothetical protein